MYNCRMLTWDMHTHNVAALNMFASIKPPINLDSGVLTKHNYKLYT